MVTCCRHSTLAHNIVPCGANLRDTPCLHRLLVALMILPRYAWTDKNRNTCFFFNEARRFRDSVSPSVDYGKCGSLMDPAGP